MNPAWQRYFEAASGLTALTAQRAERVVKGLVRSGEAATDQVSDLVDDLINRQRKNRESVVALVRSETTRAVHAMGLATTEEVERLQRQVADLKREVSRLERESGGSARPRKKATKKAAKKTGAKKGTTRKTSGAKKATKKSGAKKSAAKRSTRRS